MSLDGREAVTMLLGQIRSGESLERLIKLYEFWDAVEPGKG